MVWWYAFIKGGDQGLQTILNTPPFIQAECDDYQP
jgi:hypothetical protein